MSEQQSFWDPFEGSVSPPYMRMPADSASHLSKVFVKLQGPLFLLVFVGFIIAFLGKDWLVIGGALATFGIFGVIGIDFFTGGQDGRDRRVWSAAEQLGYRYRPKIPDNRLRRIQSHIQELFKLRVGGSIPLMIDSEMWGKGEGDISHWIGIQPFDSISLFNGRGKKANTSDGGAYGSGAMMITAYKLDRDTGIRLVLLPENLGAIGPFDRDLKTESVAFNKAFNIRVTAREDGGDLDQISVQVLQTLTPAFQTTLLDLADRFSARVIVDRDSVYFGGYANLRSLDEEVLKAFLTETVSSFALAATSFKHYAE